MEIKAFAFDAYGTLFDVGAAINRHRGRIGADAESAAALWRAKQLEYSWVLTLMGRYEDFWTLTTRALDFVLDRFPGIDRGLRQDLLDSYWQLDAYGDALAALTALNRTGKRCAIFSNGTEEMLKAAIDRAAFSGLIEGVISVEGVRQFKTAPASYALVSRFFGETPQSIALVSSNRWDVAGARGAGMQAIWCNRSGQPDEYPGLEATWTIKGLGELADL